MGLDAAGAASSPYHPPTRIAGPAGPAIRATRAHSGDHAAPSSWWRAVPQRHHRTGRCGRGDPRYPRPQRCVRDHNARDINGAVELTQEW